MTTQHPPQWGEPGYHAPRRKLTTRAKTIIAVALVGATLAVVASVAADNTAATSAAGDIDKVRLSTTDTGIKEGFVQVTNHSTTTVDYSVELRILSAAGVNLGVTYASAGNVEPGQTARADFVVTDSTADRVEVTRLRRTTA